MTSGSRVTRTGAKPPDVEVAIVSPGTGLAVRRPRSCRGSGAAHEVPRMRERQGRTAEPEQPNARRREIPGERVGSAKAVEAASEPGGRGHLESRWLGERRERAFEPRDGVCTSLPWLPHGEVCEAGTLNRAKALDPLAGIQKPIVARGLAGRSIVCFVGILGAGVRLRVCSHGHRRTPRAVGVAHSSCRTVRVAVARRAPGPLPVAFTRGPGRTAERGGIRTPDALACMPAWQAGVLVVLSSSFASGAVQTEACPAACLRTHVATASEGLAEACLARGVTLNA